MRQRAASLLRAGMLAAAAMLLSGCTLSAALRHDEIRSVWGPGRALPPQLVYFTTDRTPRGAGFGESWGGRAHCGRTQVPIELNIPPSHRAPPDVPGIWKSPASHALLPVFSNAQQARWPSAPQGVSGSQ